MHRPVDECGQVAAGGQFQVDGAQPGPQQPAQHQVVGADHGGVAGDVEALVLEGPHQQHRVLVVVREHRVEPQGAPARREAGGVPFVVGEGQLGDGGVGAGHGLAGAREARRREDVQAAFRGHDDADSAASAVVQVAGRAAADARLVREQRVRSVDGLGAEGDDRPGAGAFEDLHALRAEVGAGCEDGDRAEFGPGAGGLVAAQADGAVLHDGVVEAAERPLEFAEEPAVERAGGEGRRRHQDHAAVPGAQ